MTDRACRICKEIPSGQRAEGEGSLASSWSKLETVFADRHSHFGKCPACGAYYYHDYSPPGPGNIGDYEILERFSDEDNEYVRTIIEAKDVDALASALVQAITSALWTENHCFKSKVELAFQASSKKFPGVATALEKLRSHENRNVRSHACWVLQRWFEVS